MGVPLLDASKFNGGPEDRKQYSQELLGSLTDCGFVRLVNHGVSDQMVEDIFAWGEKLFALPLREKLEFEHPTSPVPQRGYSRIGAEKTSTLYGKMMKVDVREDLKDAREHFDCGAPLDTEFPNRWPSESQLPGFRKFMESYFNTLESVSLNILKALEEALGLPASFFCDQITHANNASELRLNHYPPITMEEMLEGSVNRIWPHFDLGVITLLFASNVGGLEIGDRKNPGSFIPVEPQSQTEMIVNISETLQRWTNDRLPAGLHQVTFPRSLRENGQEVIPRRYSVAYLCKADRNASVGAAAPFVSEGKTKYEDVTALEYHKQRLTTAY